MAKILIIGGGVAGLSAGIYAQMNGHQATICERQKTAGGNLTGWQRGEYHIDNCIHWLTGTNPATDTYKIWTDLGALGNVDVYQGNTLYTYEYKGKRLSLHRDLDKMKEEMLALAPEDKKEILSLIKAVRFLQGISGIGGKKHNKKYNIFQDLAALPTLGKYHRMTTGELSEKFSNPILKKFIVAMLGKEFSAMALIMIISTFCGENGGIPKGSSCAMAKRMTQRFLKLGGKLLLKKDAVRINKKNGKANSVTFEDGTRMQADYVIITSDPAVAFKKLLNMDVPKDLEKQYRNPVMSRFSSYQCAFSCDLEKLPFEGDFIFELSAKDKKLLKTENMIVREFSHEKDFAPKGKNILQTLTFCSEEDCKKFISLRENKVEYKKKKLQIGEAVKRVLITKFPVLKEKLNCIDVWTPATYQRYTDAEIGSFMGFILPSKAIPRTLNNRVENLKNVILATQWLQAPGGLPIAAKVGKRAIDTILKVESRR